MIDVVLIIILVKLNNERYIICYFILDYDDNIIFDYFSLFLSQFSSQSEKYIKNIVQFLSKPALERTI